MITCIRKRDGRTRPFDTEKIANAIYKAAQAIGGHDYQTSLALAKDVYKRQGLFLVRRDRIWITRSISFPRPITGSSLPSFAMAVKSRPNWSSVGVLPGPLAEEEAPPRMPSEAV